MAWQLVCRHHKTIGRVADALAEKLELMGAEIDAMMPVSWIARAYAPSGGEPYPCSQCNPAKRASPAGTYPLSLRRPTRMPFPVP
jgi:hypothetical protein